jgi:hypothetical protein
MGWAVVRKQKAAKGRLSKSERKNNFKKRHAGRFREQNGMTFS